MNIFSNNHLPLSPCSVCLLSSDCLDVVSTVFRTFSALLSLLGIFFGLNNLAALSRSVEGKIESAMNRTSWTTYAKPKSFWNKHRKSRTAYRKQSQRTAPYAHGTLRWRSGASCGKESCGSASLWRQREVLFHRRTNANKKRFQLESVNWWHL